MRQDSEEEPGGDIGDVGPREVGEPLSTFPRPRAAPRLVLGMAGGLPGNRSLSEGLTHPPLRRFPHRSAVGMGDRPTCPDWHSRAAGFVQSGCVWHQELVHIVGGTPLSQGSPRGTRLTG